MVCPFGTAKLARYCLRTHLKLPHTTTDGHCLEFTLSLRTACKCVACQFESSIAGFTVHGTRRSGGESGLYSLQQLPCAGVQEVSKGISMLKKFLIFQPNAHLYFQYMFLSHLCYMFRCVILYTSTAGRTSYFLQNRFCCLLCVVCVTLVVL